MPSSRICPLYLHDFDARQDTDNAGAVQQVHGQHTVCFPVARTGTGAGRSGRRRLHQLMLLRIRESP
jgi:hypothetical protein